MKMKIDRQKFYTYHRKHFGRLKQKQVEYLELILNFIEQKYDFSANMYRDTKIEQLAYILATVKHETGHTYKPLEEWGKGRLRKYGKAVGPYNKKYYGRGYVQLTWLFNYKKQSVKHGTDFVRYPEKALEPEHAWKILVGGMQDGDFTGKRLEDYIRPGLKNYRHARKIVNGMDKAKRIAHYAEKFEAILESCLTE